MFSRTPPSVYQPAALSGVVIRTGGKATGIAEDASTCSTSTGPRTTSRARAGSPAYPPASCSSRKSRLLPLAAPSTASSAREGIRVGDDPDRVERPVGHVGRELSGVEVPARGALQRRGVEQARGPGAAPDERAGGVLREGVAQREGHRLVHVRAAHRPPDGQRPLGRGRGVQVGAGAPERGVDAARAGAEPDGRPQPPRLERRDQHRERARLERPARPRPGQHHGDPRPPAVPDHLRHDATLLADPSLVDAVRRRPVAC